MKCTEEEMWSSKGEISDEGGKFEVPVLRKIVNQRQERYNEKSVTSVILEITH